MMSTEISNSLIHSISKRNDLNLNRLVHLALNSSPKVGIVNFNILKTFLLELLKALNLQAYEPRFNDDDTDTKNLIEDAILNETDTNDYSFIDLNDQKSTNTNNIILKTPITHERMHALEEKLNRFEKQLSALNSLPSNQHIIDKSKDLKHGVSSGPVLEIWQYTQLSKRVESNEDGLTKMTSLLQELINELNDLKENQNRTASELKSLSDQFNDLMSRFLQIEQFKNALTSLDKIKSLEEDIEQLKKDWFKIDKMDEKLKSISDRIEDVENKIIPMVSYSDLDAYATWSALEKALNGLKDQLTRKKETTQGYTQTTPPPPVTPRPVSSGGFHPSKELQDLLSKLGTLDSRHENLKDEVERLKMELDKKQNEPLKLPDDFAQKMEDIKSIKTALEQLTKDFNLETNKRLQFEKIINDLNKELESIKDSLKELMKNTNLNSELEALKEAINLIEDSKGDKSWIRSELDKKADRRDLETKVNKKLYDETNHELSHLIDNCVKKNTSLEEEWKKSSDHLLKELENKLDRLELDSIKDSIERQLKKLKRLQKESQNQMQATSNMGYMSEDEAAGLRKQLLRFHCISCDRPIEVGAQTGTIPSLPADRGIRPIQTPRPYTTFELDQIRQFQKQQYYPDNTSYDLFATYRQCGGSHTLTVPHKRIIKNVLTDNEDVRPSTSIPPLPQFSHKNEVQIQGQDGIIYKGRIDAKLSVEMKRPTTSKTTSFQSHSHQNLRASSAVYPGMRLSSLNHSQNHNNNINEINLNVQLNNSMNEDDNLNRKTIKEESNEIFSNTSNK